MNNNHFDTMSNKKSYQQPATTILAVATSSFLCASPVGFGNGEGSGSAL